MKANSALKTAKPLAITALIVLTVLGCSQVEPPSNVASSSEQAAPADQPLAACSLLTEDEWETLVGPSSAAPEQTDDEATYMTPPVQTSLCTYASQQGSILLAAERPYSSEATDSETLAADLREDPGLSSLGDVDVQPLDGLGVPAAWYDVSESANQVWVVAVSPSGGGTYLRVQAFGYPLEQAQAIAEKALSRLP